MPQTKYTLDHFDGRAATPFTESPETNDLCQDLAASLRTACFEAGLTGADATDEQIGKAVRTWLSARRNKTPQAAGWSPVAKVIEWLTPAGKAAAGPGMHAGPPEKLLAELPRVLGKLFAYLWRHPVASVAELRSLWDETVTDEAVLQGAQRLEGQLHHLAPNSFSIESNGKSVRFTRRNA